MVSNLRRTQLIVVAKVILLVGFMTTVAGDETDWQSCTYKNCYNNLQQQDLLDIAKCHVQLNSCKQSYSHFYPYNCYQNCKAYCTYSSCVSACSCKLKNKNLVTDIGDHNS